MLASRSTVAVPECRMTVQKHCQGAWPGWVKLVLKIVADVAGGVRQSLHIEEITNPPRGEGL